MSKLYYLVAGLGVGAGLMYLLDPDRGKRRRTKIRDKTADALEHAGDAIEKKGHEIDKKARGFVADTRNAISKTVAT